MLISDKLNKSSLKNLINESLLPSQYYFLSFGKKFSHPESDVSKYEIELILEIINESTFESRLQKIALTADHNSGEKRPKIIGFT